MIITAMKVRHAQPYKGDIIHVVVETPQYSLEKYAYDRDLKAFSLKKTLPAGSAFPFDFGFVPNTLCDDGDPVDALVLVEGETYPGCILAARLVGVLEAVEADKNNKQVRNDRLIAVSVESQLYKNITDVKELDKKMIHSIEDFFTSYNKQEGRTFKPLKWNNAKAAHKKVLTCKE
ncbi:inorganic pyrophosphatase (PPase) [Cytophaga hutchinsonii ATCC 33406]|uniref:inorganic diphosphatase n=2 Tax=Cytophaga hutchinsonii TaxID=985 RepID=A0A6N4SQE7_CYTH3|nr:inorganic pyrophosphatase (PPase) [Cytophaga hutchinsonii ATCC 33406]